MSATPYLGQTIDIILGQDFLTWAWFRCETDPAFMKLDSRPFAVRMGQRVTVQGGEGESLETTTVAGRMSELREARLGLAMGKKVTRISLYFEREPEEWRMTLNAGDFTLCGLKLPAIYRPEEGDDPDAIFLERLYLIESAFSMLDLVFAEFVSLRTNPAKWRGEISKVRSWIHENITEVAQ